MTLCPRRALLHQEFRSAFTLVEVMVALLIASLALLVASQVTIFTSRSFVAMGNFADLDKASRNALDKMSRDIRQARVLGSYSSTSLTFSNLDGSSFIYNYNPEDKTLVCRTSSGATETLLKGCDFFSFRVWMRNPTNGFWFPYSSTADAKLTKLVDVSWRCSRPVLNQLNTESLQAAKIVLRN